MVDLRTRRSVTAGTFEHWATDLISAWHRHDLHEIEYAVSGVAEVITPTAHYLLPPHHAAWVPAGVAHSPVLRDVHTVAVFFDPAAYEFPHAEPVIVPVPSLLREMVLHARAWPIGRTDEEEESRRFFAALADVVTRQLPGATDLSLPMADDPLIAEVIAYTTEHVADVTAASMCRALGLSERTLRRRFPEAVGRTWRDYLQQARLLRAMGLLSTPTPSVRDVSLAVGFESTSAFARAFRAWTGESPSSYRRRWLSGTGTD